jgi:hypothetical protein
MTMIECNLQFDLLFWFKLCFQMTLSSGGKPEYYTCSCAAGRLLCHHVVAFLHQLHHYQQLGLAVVPPIVSQTSLPQVIDLLLSLSSYENGLK